MIYVPRRDMPPKRRESPSHGEICERGFIFLPFYSTSVKSPQFRNLKYSTVNKCPILGYYFSILVDFAPCRGYNEVTIKKTTKTITRNGAGGGNTMKKYTALFFRSNPQLKNGGYETTRTIEAKTIASARKKAREYEDCLYGSMTLIDIKLADEQEV